MSFINISNHCSREWSSEQLQAASQFGEIHDITFPHVDPELDDSSLDALVRETITHVQKYPEPTVMVQGESVFCFRLVTALLRLGIPSVAAVSRRECVEQTTRDGLTMKYSIFQFQGFRNYMTQADTG